MLILFVPFVDLMPLINPRVLFDGLVVPLFRLAMVLLLMVTVPVPLVQIPKTLCALEVLAELALILLAVVILPIRLLLMVMVPAVFVLFIPYKLLALVASLFAVIDPIVLF